MPSLQLYRSLLSKWEAELEPIFKKMENEIVEMTLLLKPDHLMRGQFLVLSNSLSYQCQMLRRKTEEFLIECRTAFD